MIRYFTRPNILLEALAYFGRRAAGNTIEALRRKLADRGITELGALEEPLTQLQAIMHRLDQEIPAAPEVLRSLFGNLEGFPRSTVGSYSPAFLLFYPFLSGSDGEAEEIAQALCQAEGRSTAYGMAVCLELSEEDRELSDREFSARVLAMQVPPETKVAILDLLHDPGKTADAALPWLKAAVEILRQEAPRLEALSDQFGKALQAMGAAAFLSQTSGLSADASYDLYPFLLGMDTNLAGISGAGNPVYCGICRMALQDLLTRQETPTEDVYEAIRLLADRTRFDILCYLRDHTAYGQELSDRFGLSRNTIHHHMAKLLSAHLVRCTVDGNRVYYTTDRQAVTALLEQQKKLLLS